MKQIFLSFLLICSIFCLWGEEHFLFHGSSTDGIERLNPRLRYTPGEESASPAGVYASDLPAFAAAHSFSWSSDEGIDLYVDGSIVTLEIPRGIADRLQRATYLYVVDARLFSLVACESSGHTFRATSAIDCVQKISFRSVAEAIEYFGGQVIIKDTNQCSTSAPHVQWEAHPNQTYNAGNIYQRGLST